MTPTDDTTEATPDTERPPCDHTALFRIGVTVVGTCPGCGAPAEVQGRRDAQGNLKEAP